MLLIFISDPETGITTERVTADQPLKFIEDDGFLPAELENPKHRLLGYPRVIDLSEFNRETDRHTKTLPLPMPSSPLSTTGTLSLSANFRSAKQ